MEFTTINCLNQKVSRIGLGTWSIGGWMWGGSDEKSSIATIHRALDLGINLIDTAPVYGFGLSEEIIGKALSQYGKKDQIIIATKAGLSWKKGKIYRDSRKDSILQEIEASLKRLKVDYIDLYQLHWPDALIPFSETAEGLIKLLKEGKVKAIGVSNFSVDQLKEFQEALSVSSLQSPFNLFEREIEKEELAYCLKNKIAVLGYGSLCRGLLSGKMTETIKFEGDDIRKVDPKFRNPRFHQYISCTDKLQRWSMEKFQKPLSALALRWSLDKGVSIALFGARKPTQLEEIALVFDWKLSSTDFMEIDEIIAREIVSPIGPEFMAPPLRLK